MGTPKMRWAALLLVLLLSLTLVVYRIRSSRRYVRVQSRPGEVRKRPAPEPAAGEVGARVPNVRFRDISGQDLSLDQFRGKVLLVDYWATWCAPCKVEMPGYQEFENRYGDRLAVIGIALDSDPATVVKFAKKLGVHYTLALNTPELEKAFGGVLGLPTTCLVDRDRITRQKVIG